MAIAFYRDPAPGRGGAVLAAAFLAALLLACGAAAQAAPFVPQSGAQVLETLPRSSAASDAGLRALRSRLAGNPYDALLAASVAQRYIELGRAASDPRYFGYAQAALAPWWRQAAPPPALRLLRATLLQTGHRFDAALADLHAVVRSDPSNAQAWLTLATVQVVRGEPGAAMGSCGHLAPLAGQLVAVTCLANARAANGELASSERLLALVLDRTQGEQPATRVWALTLLGEIAARRGEGGLAAARYRQALALAPEDSYLLAAYADLLLAQQRHGEVLALLRERQRVDALLLRYALALAGSDADSTLQRAARDELQARFDAAARRGEALHQREQARFALYLQHDARSALRLALDNWRVQKEPADLRIVLEAALAARNPAAVREVLAWRRRQGMEDAAIAQLARRLEGSAS